MNQDQVLPLMSKLASSGYSAELKKNGKIEYKKNKK